MSEEINEDNCVLSEDEIACIQVTFEEKFVTHGKLFTDKLDKILLKITKLNEMAKELREMENEAPTAYRLLYKEKGK